MQSLERVGSIVLFAALLVWLPGQAAAQQVGVNVDGHGGVALPASNLGDFQDLGPSFGLGFEYELADRVALRASGSLDLLKGAADEDISATFAAPDVSLFHYHGGIALRLSPPEATAWDVSVNLGVGATTVDSDDFPAGAATPAGESSFSATYFSLHPGLTIGYDVNEQVGVFVRGDGHFAFADGEETAVFGQFDTDIPDDGFEELWDVPVTAGLEVSF